MTNYGFKVGDYVEWRKRNERAITEGEASNFEWQSGHITEISLVNAEVFTFNEQIGRFELRSTFIKTNLRTN